MTDTVSMSRLSRSQLLRRLPTRRASMILIAIENQAGYLVGKSKQVANRYLTDKTAEEFDRVFMEALSMGREAPIRPSILLHGLVIWQDALQRLAALAAGPSVVAMTVVVMRKGAFRPCAVVEFRTEEDMGDRAFFNVTVAGRPMSVDVHLNYDRSQRQISASSGDVPAFTTLRSVVFRLPSLQPRELKVWAHQITPEGTSQPMPVSLEAQCGQETKSYDLRETGGQIIFPLSGQPCQLTIQLA
jgi:hypothetical protein